MTRRTALAILPMLSMLSCDAPGQHAANEAVIRPNDIADFRWLYAQNCSGCHGPNGQGALSLFIGNPVYLAIADDPAIRRIIEEGRTGTAMPAFARKAGGFLTDAQIDILVRGIRAWSRPGDFASSRPPGYSTSQTGDAARGRGVFTANCSLCHAASASGSRVIAAPSYLALVSDQYLRTVIIVGVPYLGMPDWRGHASPLSEADVTDVVAWLASYRAPSPAGLNDQGGSK